MKTPFDYYKKDEQQRGEKPGFNQAAVLSIMLMLVIFSTVACTNIKKNNRGYNVKRSYLTEEEKREKEKKLSNNSVAEESDANVDKAEEKSQKNQDESAASSTGDKTEKNQKLEHDEDAGKKFAMEQKPVIPIPEDVKLPDDVSLEFEDSYETRYLQYKLKNMINLLKEEYYRELDDEEILDAMIRGVADNLESKYTLYMDPDVNAEVAEAMSGEYTGIGVMVQLSDGVVRITDIMDGSPAGEVGMQIGDIFEEVNGEQTVDLKELSPLVSKIRGEPGTTVDIKIYRESDKKSHDFTVERRKIKNANIRSEYIEDGIGYIRLLEFNSGLAQNFMNAMDELQEEGAETFIFDLRNNGGGYVNEVLNMLDYILSDEVLAWAEGRDEGRDFKEVWRSEKKVGVDTDTKFVIIVNNYSASASELFTGSLRDHGRAEIVGETTFGKGVGTIAFNMDDGSSIQITNFHYFLPGGDCVDGVGIEPDYVVEQPKDLAGLSVSQIEREDDVQLQKALELARGYLKD